jgi:hypothetical protein
MKTAQRMWGGGPIEVLLIMEFYEIAGVCRVAINYPCMAHRQFSGL